MCFGKSKSRLHFLCIPQKWEEKKELHFFQKQRKSKLLFILFLFVAKFCIIWYRKTEIKYESFNLDKRRNFCTLRTVSRGIGCVVAQAPSLEAFNTWWDKAWSILLWLHSWSSLEPELGDWTGDLLGPSQPKPPSQRHIGAAISADPRIQWAAEAGKSQAHDVHRTKAGGPQAYSHAPPAAPAAEEAPCSSYHHLPGLQSLASHTLSPPEGC